MSQNFTFSQFQLLYNTDEKCLEEIKRLQYPKGISCISCKKITKHYKLKNRTAYACKFCRNQVYPLSGTIFEKSTTPLTVWFYAHYLMIYTHGKISVKKLQNELGVTYKTAWRMYKRIYTLMSLNNGDLLKDSEADSRVHKWLFFNKIQLTVVQKQESAK